MISPSENAGMGAGSRTALRLPERLMKPGSKSVSRLEFYPADQPEPVAENVADGKVEDAEILLKETKAQEFQSQAEEMSVRIERERSEAAVEARALWEAELEERIAKERLQLRKVGEDLLRERTKYFVGVESEVVRLALAIAARVLHREVKLDPLLLTGVVRVALEKVAKDSAVVLSVPTDELEMWQGVFVANRDSAVRVVGDEQLGVGECVLETNVGRVELGVSAQLDEIERGFFDLMQQRPA